MSKFLIVAIILLLIASNFFVVKIGHAALFSKDPKCWPIGCQPFGGPILSFTPVSFCGDVIVVGRPSPITAVYVWQPYKFNPPIYTSPFGPANPRDQNVVGKANLFNPNIFCPLPIVVLMGVSKYHPHK